MRDAEGTQPLLFDSSPDLLARQSSVELLLTSLLGRTKVKNEPPPVPEDPIDPRRRSSSMYHNVSKRLLAESTEKELVAGLDAAVKRQKQALDNSATKAKDKLKNAWQKFETENSGTDESPQKVRKVAECERALQTACQEASMLLDQGKHINLPVNPFKGGLQSAVCFSLLCLYTCVVVLFLIDEHSLPSSGVLSSPLMIFPVIFIIYAVVFKIGMAWCPDFRFHWSGVVYKYVRLRISYFLLFNLVIVVATFAGILIETFCCFIINDFVPETTWLGISTKTLSSLFFFLLPDEIIVFSLYCEYCFKLALDTFDSPPLIGFQSALLALLHKHPHPHQHFKNEDDAETNWIVRKLDSHTQEHEEENQCPVKKSTCIIVDVITVLVAEVLPMMWAVWCVIQYWGFSDRSHVGAGLRGYLWAGMGSASLMTCIFIVCNLVFAVRDRRKSHGDQDHDPECPIETRSYAEALECFDQALNRNLIFPGTLTFHHKECFERHLFDKHILGANSAAALERRPIRKEVGGKIPVDYIGHVLLLVMWGVCVSIAKGWLDLGDIQHACWALAAMMVVTVGGGTLLLNMRFPGVIGMTYYGVNIFFLLVGLGLLSAASLDVKAPRATLIVTDPNNSTNHDDFTAGIRSSAEWTGGPTTYPVCRIEWGAPGAPLNALDISQLASLMYAGECSEIDDALSKVFPNIPTCRAAHTSRADWAACRHFHSCADYNTFPRIGVFDFYPPEDADSQIVTRIVALKGTSTAKDIYLDTTLWSTVKVLQAFGLILPVISVMPLDQVQWMLDKGHMPFERAAEQLFWSDTVAGIERFVEDGIETVLTGHSLGGGVAQVVAARLGLPALVWSAPGMGYSARRFGIHKSTDWSASSLAFWMGMGVETSDNVTHEHAGVESSAHQTIVVVPESDVVPRCDLQVAVVQPIECRTDDGQYGGALDCHSIDKTSCEIWRSCGDWPSRGRIINCSHYVDADEIGAWYKPDDI